jgi:streptomycin 3"-kinase
VTADLLPPGDHWDPVPGGESGATVHRRTDGAAFAKCVAPDGAPALRGERDRIRWLSGTGVPGPSVLDWSCSDLGACLVTSTVPGVPASELSSDALLAAWPSIVGTLRGLHALPAASCPFERGLATMFAIAEDVVGRGAVHPEFLTDEQRDVPAADLLAGLRVELGTRLAQEPGDLVVCHGDACLPNFLVDPDALTCTGLIDLGRLGTADRHADLALLRANARESWTGDAATHADLHLGDVDPARMRFYLDLDPLTW